MNADNRVLLVVLTTVDHFLDEIRIVYPTEPYITRVSHSKNNVILFTF